RFALVNREADLGNDPGPCAELARARRLEQVDYQQSQNSKLAACALPCDVDLRVPGRAQNSAAYLEVDEAVDVAVIADTEVLPEPGDRRACFGLPAHALPEMCESQAACGP